MSSIKKFSAVGLLLTPAASVKINPGHKTDLVPQTLDYQYEVPVQFRQPVSWENAHEEDDFINRNHRLPANSLAQIEAAPPTGPTASDPTGQGIHYTPQQPAPNAMLPYSTHARTAPLALA